MIIEGFHEKIVRVEHTNEPSIPIENWFVEFTNGWAISVVQSPYCYSGPNNDLFELTVKNPEGDVDYNNPVADDVVGYLTEAGVIDYLRKLSALTAEELQHYRNTHVSRYDEEEEGSA